MQLRHCQIKRLNKSKLVPKRCLINVKSIAKKAKHQRIRYNNMAKQITTRRQKNIPQMLRRKRSAKINKFDEYGLVKEKAKKVKSPRLKSNIGILECRLRRDKALLKKYNIVLGDVVYAEAEKSVFTDRWLPELEGPRIMHHLGGKIFSVPDKRIT
jgi:flavin reductase (DIM6/NTAB) family NADH-FMN oxidoreductase RutF